jgi:transcriptional regulator with XRE-family HTH domain
MKIIFHVEVPGLGSRVKDARLSDPRSLLAICREVGMSPRNWYNIEDGVTKALPVETLRRIEAVLGVDFGVKTEDNHCEN